MTDAPTPPGSRADADPATDPAQDPAADRGLEPVLDPVLDPGRLRALVTVALDEDLGPAPGRDVTTQATILPSDRGAAHLVARAPGVVAGLPVLRPVLDEVAGRLGLERVDVRLLVADGAAVTPGQVLAVLTG
ncbi:MAG TPA: hypothetical protein VN257_09270, partial [Actinotalea sp.]|nr:hypothetical protein [Actinotalea sp.]